ncbi:MAG: tRNA (adenosine(37)-N6)-threonylcarbamoyltransferase complex ATPase subunit type 1 TsaE [Bacteroidetes bacterium]|nr:tRNA (adenosine(37)-N6)-threonylcarbamoyltransferase complex ATPase subunit type 1 TsaE [Bacteroidota bacterium]
MAYKVLAARNNLRQLVFMGEVGAGKTTLIKSICEILGVEDDVESPTFSLVNTYQSKLARILHIDLYRLQPGEIESAGLEAYFEDNYDLIFIEWPEKAPEVLDSAFLLVKLAHSNETRFIECSTVSA